MKTYFKLLAVGCNTFILGLLLSPVCSDGKGLTLLTLRAIFGLEFLGGLFIALTEKPVN